ncbi:unnamed protein product [Meganyctiphanes norvegica]|uniref:Uncharacterized protein n=1 Tax=Meganyctiphanes norvegica TaxID=48144 RepID=A0AAV2RHI6_MEGNR
MPITPRTSNFRHISSATQFNQEADHIMRKVKENINFLKIAYNPIINIDHLNIITPDGTHPSELSYLGISHKICTHIKTEIIRINNCGGILRRAPAAILPTPTAPSPSPSLIPPPPPSFSSAPMPIAIPPPPQFVDQPTINIDPSQMITIDNLMAQALPSPNEFWGIRHHPAPASPSSPSSTSTQNTSISVPSAHPSPALSPKSPTQLTPSTTPPTTPPSLSLPSIPSPSSTQFITQELKKLAISKTAYYSRSNWRGRRPIHNRASSNLDQQAAKRRERPSPIPSPPSKTPKVTVADRLLAQVRKSE